MAYFISTSTNRLNPGRFEYPAGVKARFIDYIVKKGSAAGFPGGFDTMSGVRLDREELPRKPRAMFKTKKLGNIVNTSLAWLVSQKAKDFLDGLEPGVHQFEPADLEQQDGSPWPEPYWTFVLGTRLDTAVDETNSNVVRSYSDKPFWSFGSVTGVTPRISLRKEIIGNHMIWCDARLTLGPIMSDRFWELSQQEGFKEIERGDFERQLIEI